jgi:hypothetical protein
VEEGVKLVPLAFRVIKEQNSLPFDIGFAFNETDSDHRKTIKINTNFLSSNDRVPVDLEIYEGTHQPITSEMALFITDPKREIDLRPFQGLHDLNEKVLNEGIAGAFALPNAPKGTMVYVGSPLYDICMGLSERYNLTSDLMFHIPFRSQVDGTPFQVCVLPPAIIEAGLSHGKEIIDTLPFQDPQNVVVTVKRSDGQSFDAINNELDRELLLNQQVPFGFTLEEVYAPFYIRHK